MTIGPWALQVPEFTHCYCCSRWVIRFHESFVALQVGTRVSLVFNGLAGGLRGSQVLGLNGAQRHNFVVAADGLG